MLFRTTFRTVNFVLVNADVCVLLAQLLPFKRGEGEIPQRLVESTQEKKT